MASDTAPAAVATVRQPTSTTLPVTPTSVPALAPASPLPTAEAQPARETSTSQPGALPSPATTPVPTSTATAPVPVYTYRVIDAYPHDPTAFTQGLVYQDGIFFEGTGLRGQSTLRRVEPSTGRVLRGVRLPDAYFGEGIAVLGDRLYQLTWQENTGFVYDKTSLELRDVWNYPGEGWGLTTDGRQLIMSDGTHELRFLDPSTLEETERVAVFDADGAPIVRLNELEWVQGEVWANIWQTDRIARIEPSSGRLLGWIDLTGLLPEEDRAAQRVDVLNGIAYDAASDRLFVTGKWWPKLFEIELVEDTP